MLLVKVVLSKVLNFVLKELCSFHSVSCAARPVTGRKVGKMVTARGASYSYGGYGMSTTRLYKSLSSRFISNCGYRTILRLHNSKNLVPVNSNCCGTATEILGTGNLEGYKSMSNFMLLFDRKQWLTILRF